MINSEPGATQSGRSQDEAVDAIVSTGARGAVALAGIATAIVIGLWIAFYLLVFVPRGAAP
jgi:hypothetical protein